MQNAGPDYIALSEGNNNFADRVFCPVRLYGIGTNIMAGSNIYPLRIADAARSIRHVFIHALELEADIGIHGHEIGTPQPVRISVDLGVSDDTVDDARIETVVDYEVIGNRIRALVATGHVNLAETLAERIATVCFTDRRVKSVRVRVEKLTAMKNAAAVGVEIERVRS